MERLKMRCLVMGGWSWSASKHMQRKLAPAAEMGFDHAATLQCRRNVAPRVRDHAQNRGRHSSSQEGL